MRVSHLLRLKMKVDSFKISSMGTKTPTRFHSRLNLDAVLALEVATFSVSQALRVPTPHLGVHSRPLATKPRPP